MRTEIEKVEAFKDINGFVHLSEQGAIESSLEIFRQNMKDCIEDMHEENSEQRLLDLSMLSTAYAKMCIEYKILLDKSGLILSDKHKKFNKNATLVIDCKSCFHVYKCEAPKDPIRCDKFVHNGRTNKEKDV